MTLFPKLDRDADTRDVWMKALLAGGALFVVWRVFRGMRSLFWSVFGMAMAVHYSGVLDWWS